MRRAAVVLGALLLLLGLPRCSSGPAPIRIGAVYPMTGPQGAGGLDEYRGVRLAVDLVDQDGGVNGRKVVLQPLDVTGPDGGPSAIDQLAARGVKIVFGTYGSTISATAAGEVARRDMLLWETGAVGGMTGPGPGRSFFRVAPSGAGLGRSAVDFVTRELAPLLRVRTADLRFAVTNVDDTYGQEVARGALQAIRAGGLTLTGTFSYDPRRLDAPAIARAVERSGANVVFASAYVEDAVAIRKEMVRQGLRLITGIGTSSSYCMPEFGAALGREAVGLFASDKPDGWALDRDGLLPAARALLDRAQEAYEARYHAYMSAPALAGFSGAWALLHDVLPRAGSITAPAVASAALAARIPEGGLPNGSGLRFGEPGTPEAGENLLAASVIWEWVAPGHRVVVWPPRFATQAIEPIRPMP